MANGPETGATASVAGQASTAAAAPEPVAWANSASLTSAGISRRRGGPFDRFTCSEGQTSHHDTPLYTHPAPAVAATVPAAQPLDDEMMRQCRAECDDDYTKRGIFISGWIGAERAHGIATPAPKEPGHD